MKKYMNVDTGVVWTLEEIRKGYDDFRFDSEYMRQFESFGDYLEDQLSLGRSGQGGIVEAKWYAVQRSSEDEWNNGSYDIEEAKEMLREQGCGLIAVIDENNSFCIEEIRYEDLD